jgi:hypothetical protein
MIEVLSGCQPWQASIIKFTPISALRSAHVRERKTLHCRSSRRFFTKGSVKMRGLKLDAAFVLRYSVEFK